MNIESFTEIVSKFREIDADKKYHYIGEYLVIVHSHGVTSVFKYPSSASELIFRIMPLSTSNRLSKGSVSIYCSDKDIDIHTNDGNYTIDHCIDDINDDILFQYSTVIPYTQLIMEHKHEIQFVYHNKIDVRLDYDYDTLELKLREYYERAVNQPTNSGRTISTY